MEVIYTGLHQTPEQIVETVIQEDADAVGLSILSGAHMTLVPRIMELLREQGADDVVVTVGGTIPADDVAELKELGVAEVFTPGASTRTMSTSSAPPSAPDRPVHADPGRGRAAHALDRGRQLGGLSHQSQPDASAPRAAHLLAVATDRSDFDGNHADQAEERRGVTGMCAGQSKNRRVRDSKTIRVINRNRNYIAGLEIPRPSTQPWCVVRGVAEPKSIHSPERPTNSRHRRDSLALAQRSHRHTRPVSGPHVNSISLVLIRPMTASSAGRHRDRQRRPLEPRQADHVPHPDVATQQSKP